LFFIKVIVMKKIMKKFLSALFIPLVLAAGVLPAASYAADKMPVVASFSILGDLVQIVGGDRVAVITLVGPNQDAHLFEPKPTDAKNLLQSKLLATNGLGFEPWAQKLVKSTGFKGPVLQAAQGIQSLAMPPDKPNAKPETDPHAWQNPNNVAVYVRNIADALTKLDPAGAAIFKTNSEAYIAELKALDTWAKEQFAAIPQDKRKAITSHDAFGYFAAHYQITFLAPQGMSTEAEPSAKQVAQLIRQIKAEKIKAVFVENMSNPKLLAQLAKDAGVTPGAALYADALSTADQLGGTYLKMMRHNVAALAAGMKQN
jgi:zinc/manganese transport system substrate-binding protein